MEEELFLDRADAGRRLAERLQHYAGKKDIFVLGLPRGGVPVAYEVATRLNVPLDIFLVRKLGVPGQRELAMGAVASGGVLVENRDVIRMFAIPRQVIEDAAARELDEIERLEAQYRHDYPAVDVRGKTVILVDDGLATGSTMLAAVEALSRRQTAGIVVAVPVGARRTCQRLSELVDEVVCLAMPEGFRAVGEWYLTFGQTTDAEVSELLREAMNRRAPAGGRR
jgi:putative phosphoribosyl transferase